MESGTDLVTIKAVLGRYMAIMLHNPAVLKAPQKMRNELGRELKDFLLAHIQHALDNARFSTEPAEKPPRACSNGTGPHASAEGGRIRQFKSPGYSFHKWANDISANHTSCPFSFVFFQCLSSRQDHHSTGRLGAKTAYLAENACCHLASLCRMYNDSGSLARDYDEVNLNSVNFPEFDGRDQEAAKSELMAIAQYERELLEVALGHPQDIGATRPK